MDELDYRHIRFELSVKFRATLNDIWNEKYGLDIVILYTWFILFC